MSKNSILNFSWRKVHILHHSLLIKERKKEQFEIQMIEIWNTIIAPIVLKIMLPTTCAWTYL